MSLGNGETITVTVPGAPTGAFDAKGNPVLGASVVSTIDDVGVAPLAGVETAEVQGDVSVNGFTLFLPYGSVLPANAVVTVRGAQWPVEADATQGDWVSPFDGWAPGTVATVRRVS